LDGLDLIVMKEAAPQGHKGGKGRQNGDDTHYSPLRRNAYYAEITAHFAAPLVTNLPQ
jgi:hypothetical protein